MFALWLILAVFVIIILSSVGVFNALVGLHNQVKNAWAQIDVQLKRRYDLIPNLVETAKGYATHERETFEGVAAARSKAMSSESIGDKAKSESALSSILGKLFVLTEKYPELQANQNFLALKEELVSTENKISFARQNYNDIVYVYNNKIQMFPSNIVANAFKFEASEFFQLDNPAEEKKAPKVSF